MAQVGHVALGRRGKCVETLFLQATSIQQAKAIDLKWRAIAEIHLAQLYVLYKKKNIQARFQVLTLASLKMSVLWDATPHSHVDIDRLSKQIETSILSLTIGVVIASETSAT